MAKSFSSVRWIRSPSCTDDAAGEGFSGRVLETFQTMEIVGLRCRFHFFADNSPGLFDHEINLVLVPIPIVAGRHRIGDFWSRFFMVRHAWRMQGRAEESLSLLEPLAPLHSGSPSFLLEWGLALGATGRSDEALDALRRSVQLAPEHAPAWRARR